MLVLHTCIFIDCIFKLICIVQCVSKRMVQSENIFYKYEICLKSICI